MLNRTHTAEQILEVAQALIQQRGFNAVSYADISSSIGIRNASIHYHFPSKADLGTALVKRYRERVAGDLAAITQGGFPAPQALEHYLAAYRSVVQADGRICLCTALAGDLATLPESMCREVQAFFDLNLSWLRQSMERGRDQGTLHFSGTPLAAASAFLAAVEGAMLLARAHRKPDEFGQVGQHLLATLTTS